MAEVFDRIGTLDALRLEDDLPNIEGPSQAVGYNSQFSFNYADRCAFETTWIDEMPVMQCLEETLKAGEAFISMVYTYRSCSKALPQVKTADQPNKNQIYEGTYEVLEPEIKKLKDFMYFQRDTIKQFCDHVKRLASAERTKKSDWLKVSETLIGYLIRMLDLFALLDALKNMKACLNNDFAFYKRSFGFLRKNMSSPDDQTNENHNLYLFLAHPNSITTNLKTELQAIDGFDDVIALVVNQCADYLESGLYLLPVEKHCLLRVMPYALFLMDGDDKHNMFKNKNLNLSKVAKLFRKSPVVPLCGDMQITLEFLIKRSPHFDEKVWGSDTENIKISQEYEIIHLLSSTRASHNSYLARFANTVNETRVAQLSAKSKPGESALSMDAREITSCVLQGMQLLSDWSSKVLQQSAWKYAKPNNDPAIESTAEYERVVKFNYTSEERFALVEFIAMIKGLSGLILREESVLSPIIKRCIHDELQEFVQITLREMIRAVSKNTKKKADVRSELLQLRAIAADWMGGNEPVDPALYGKKPSKDDEKVQYPSRAVGPSATQLDLIRNIVYGLLLKKKEFSGSQVKDLEDFYNKSFFYKYLLHIGETITAITDLADLWYREFYLELTKRLQFPIEMSLPWILTDHILESHDASMMEFVLFPLDIYNDAANRALQSLHQRFLYDEIEAEVNLCFDQLLFKLSEQSYTHYKIQASSILLDKPYKTQLETVYSQARFQLPKSRYDVLLRQRHFQLLGRSLDLNNLISQRQNTYIRQNIDYVINRFEASDITTIVELEQQLLNIRLTHRLLSEHVELDPFDAVLAEVNESTSLVSFHGRIVLHIIFELMYDFLPNFNFNSITQRFLRTAFSFREAVPRDAMPKSNPNFLYGNKALNGAYANGVELYKKFIGLPHITSMIRLIGKSGLPLVLGEILRNMELKVVNVLAPYVRELMGGMPQSSKLPIHDYGTEGGYGYFQLKLKDIFTYPDLRPEVLHNFREFGNSVVLMNLVDLAMTQLDIFNYVQSAPFLGIVPNEPAPDGDASAASPLYAHLQRVAQFLQAKPELAKAPAFLKEIVANAWRADKLYRPLDSNISIFKTVLHRVDATLNPVRAEWSGTAPENGVMCVDSTTEFYRLWSALQFVCCLPTSENDASCHELFGDGLMWAGCTIIHFLGQQHRFETFDFSYHILNVEEAAAVPCTKANVKQFFRTVNLFRDLNHSIFSILNTYAPRQLAAISMLHPPSTDQADLSFITNTEADMPNQQMFMPPMSDTPPPPPPMGDMGMPPPPPPDFDMGNFMPPPPPPPM